MIDGSITFTAHANVEGKRLVKMNSAKVEHATATATDNAIGVTKYPVLAGSDVAVDTLQKAGSLDVTANGAITAGADVYQAADGKISALSATNGTYRKIGVALEAASADGDIISIIPCLGNVTTTVSQ